LAHRDSFHPSSLRPSRGTFYFGQLGTFHFGATVRDGKTQPDVAKMLTADFGWAEPAANRTATGLINEFKR